MKKRARILAALLCAVALLLSVTVTAGAAGVEVAAGSAAVEVGSGTENVVIPITLSGNTGLAGLQLAVSYTEGLTVKSIEHGDAFESKAFTKPGIITANPFNMLWDGTDADSSNGELALITFEVPKGTAKEYAINVSVVGAYNGDDVPQSVAVTATGGKITVSESSKENFTGLTFDDAEFTYDGTAKALTVKGLPSGASVTYTSEDFDADGKAVDAGTYNITATVSKAGYNNWTKEAILTIAPKPVSITGLTAEGREYDGSVNIALSGGVLSGVVGSDDVTCNIPAVGSVASADAGTNKPVTVDKITLQGADAGNYVLSQPQGLTASISKVPITIKAKNASKTFAEKDPVLEYEITEGRLVGNDAVTGALARKAGEEVGTYDILQGTLAVSSNYQLTFVPGVFEIKENTNPYIAVSSERARAGETVEVKVSINNNPGFGGMAYEVQFDDSVLTLESYELDLGKAICSAVGKYEDKINFQYAGIENMTGDGNLVVLTFLVKEDAEPTFTEIKVVPEEGTFFGYEGREEINYDLDVIDGGVEIFDYIPGDANGDGVVNNRDAARILQFKAGWDVEIDEAASDVNDDGIINNRDAARILQFKAGWDVVLN